MITGRVCDRCGEPVDNKRCQTMTRTFSDPRDPAVTNDLCDTCMSELHTWLCIRKVAFLEARKTLIGRYAEYLRKRAETMPIEESVGEVPEGIMVFYPDERYGLVSFQKDIGMTILGNKEVTYRAPYGWHYNRVHLYDDGEDGPSVGIGLACGWKSVEIEPFTLGGRTGRVVNAKQFGSRENPPDWW